MAKMAKNDDWIAEAVLFRVKLLNKMYHCDNVGDAYTGSHCIPTLSVLMSVERREWDTRTMCGTNIRLKAANPANQDFVEQKLRALLRCLRLDVYELRELCEWCKAHEKEHLMERGITGVVRIDDEVFAGIKAGHHAGFKKHVVEFLPPSEGRRRLEEYNRSHNSEVL